MEHSNEYYELQNELLEAAQESSVINLVTKLGLIPTRDGNQWCYLLGEDLQCGITGFGDSAFDAANDFRASFYRNDSKSPTP